jgi:hypothetical protein
MEKGFGLVMMEIAKTHTAIVRAKLWDTVFFVGVEASIIGAAIKLFMK